MARDGIPAGVRLASRYRLVANRTYATTGPAALQLDLYVQEPGRDPAPVFIFLHGGGWVTGTKEGVALHVLPWLEEGWAVANVEYRLAGAAPAPAAAWDARRALEWVVDHAGEYGLRRDRVVMGGMSSGAHLALLAGMGAELPGEAGAGAERAAASPAAAIVSWFGISDVADLLRGHRPRRYARRWVGEGAAALSLARALSPVEFVTAKTPPVVSVHGTLDPTVPYEQSARLHEALERCGVRHRLFTVPEGGHGDFAEEVWAEAYACVFEFLRVNVL